MLCETRPDLELPQEKAIGDQHGIGIEIEHFPDPVYDREKKPRIFADDGEQELRLADHRLHSKKTKGSVEPKYPLKTIFHNPFHAWNRMDSIELQETLPIIRRSEGQFELDALRGFDMRCPNRVEQARTLRKQAIRHFRTCRRISI